MLIFFFILIFIAEVKITYDIVCFIRHLDAKVCKLNNQITALNPKIDYNLTNIRIAINKALLSLNKIQLKIKEKKEEYKIVLLKNIVTGVLFLILNTKGQKIFSVIDLAFDIKDLYKKWSKIV